VIKIIWGYKIVKVTKDRFEIKHPFRLSVKKFNLRQLLLWKETSIKTGSGYFKELSLHFENGYKTTLSFQENTNYNRIIAYLLKKVPKKQTKS